MKYSRSVNSCQNDRPPKEARVVSAKRNDICCDNPLTQVGETLFLLVKAIIETLAFCYVEWKIRRRIQ